MKRNQDEENLLVQRIREHPELARCLLEMTDIVGEDLGNVELADDVEEVVVENIRKTGKELLTTWAVKKATLAAEQAKEETGTRTHEKKAPMALAQHTKIERHVKVRAEASPYDPDSKEYFIKREMEKMRKKKIAG